MHLKRIGWMGTVVAVLAMSAVATVWAQTGGGYDASYNAETGAGTTMGGGGFVLQTGVGQPVTGHIASGGSFSLDMGVLAGGEGTAAAPGSPTASPSASATPSASPSPPGTPMPYKRYGPQVAKDGIN